MSLYRPLLIKYKTAKIAIVIIANTGIVTVQARLDTSEKAKHRTTDITVIKNGPE
jgi:hypothetical protein